MNRLWMFSFVLQSNILQSVEDRQITINLILYLRWYKAKIDTDHHHSLKRRRPDRGGGWTYVPTSIQATSNPRGLDIWHKTIDKTISKAFDDTIALSSQRSRGGDHWSHMQQSIDCPPQRRRLEQTEEVYHTCDNTRQ